MLGRPAVSEEERALIRKEVDLKCRRERKVKSVAVSEVARDHELSDRLVWSILKEPRLEEISNQAADDSGDADKSGSNQDS
jgi:hypothetical protein